MAADDYEAEWFVSCSWYAVEDGELYCHGNDGHPTYIRCRDASHAAQVAREHQRSVDHRGKPDQSISRSVASDVCRSTQKGGKRLMKRYGGYDQVSV